MPKNITLKKKFKLKLVESLPEKLNIKTSQNISQMQDKSMIYNQDLINVLGKLKDIMITKGEPFRAKAYQKAQETVMTFPENITDPVTQLKGKPGIGETILTKFKEFTETGTISILEKEKNNPINLFTKIYGVGPKKAQELVASGINTISELENHPEKLNDIQKVGLKHYNDINVRIPRNEIDDFYIKLGNIFEELGDSKSTFDVVGSYRRGAIDSGDIDVIITNENDDNSIFNTVLDILIDDGTIIEVLSRGKVKSLVIGKIYPDKKSSISRRIDFLYSPPQEYPFAILYFTGSMTFNTLMRQRALHLGYTLNEHGISYMKNGIKGKKVEEKFTDEKSIFDFLGMKYKKPEERIDGRSIQLQEMAYTTVSEKKKISEDDKSILDSKNITSGTLHNKTIKKQKTTSTEEYIDKFKKEGISALIMMSEPEINKLIKDANNAYYCDEKPVLTDNLYDILIQYTLDKYPENTVAKQGHTSCDITVEKNKVKLPYELWSMDKIKPTSDAVSKWSNKYKGPYVISCKLDGISALYVSGENSKQAKLYTRGNGIYGQDISHLIPYLIRNKYDFETVFAIRGEIIIKKNIFNTKYIDKFSNPRNFVAGIVNKKTVNPEMLADIDFVPYEVINPQLKPSQQIKFLLDEWISPPVNFVIMSKISNENLSELLLKWRKEYDYEIDGVIVVDDKIYPRPKKNPDYAFAFKMVISDQVMEAKVVDVIWTPSKDGYLKPRVRIEPIVIGGAKIEYATGFNAKFIKDNNIGVGALISIMRSGDVIPHIISVVVPAENPMMPDLPFKWNETGVDIILDAPEKDSTVIEKNITGFFKGIGVDGLGSGNVKRIIDAGFNTVPKIIAMNKSDYLTVDGFKDKLATKIMNSIKEKIDSSTLVELMSASNIFGRGFGEKRFTSILKMYPDILTSNIDDSEKINMVTKIDGIADKTAQHFVENIPNFITFMNDSGLQSFLHNSEQYSKIDDNKVENYENHPLFNKKIVMSGFRNKELIKKIKLVGADNTSTVTKNTFILIVKDKNDDTTKIEDAKKLNISIMTEDEFINKYFPL